MAYKDEYEVARLYTDGAFRQRLEAQFEGALRPRVHLAPPLLSRPDPLTGERNAERILVVIDAAHVSLLRHSVEASPRFELIEVNEYLGVPQGAQRQVVPLL